MPSMQALLQQSSKAHVHLRNAAEVVGRQSLNLSALTRRPIVTSPLVLFTTTKLHQGFGNRGASLTTAMEVDTPVVPDENLARLRARMAAANGGVGVHAYIVPTEDPHMSEYSPECYMRRAFISKFTGTAGTVVVTPDKALLWTDGRYFLQATQELGKEWTLMKAGTPGCPDLEDWVAENLPEVGCVGIDPFLHTIDSVRRLQGKLKARGKQVVPLLVDGNLVDKVWGSAQPAAPAAPLRVHPERWAGETVANKLRMLRDQLQSHEADVLVVTGLDEVAWLMNLRGSDVPYNPVFLSYALVTEDSATLYVDTSKVTPSVAEHLKAASVEVRNYQELIADVRGHASAGQTLWMDPARVSYAIYQAAKEAAEAKHASDPCGKGKKRGRQASDFGAGQDTTAPAQPANGTSSNGVAAAASAKTVFEAPSPIISAKAIKNKAELEGMQEAHLRDAVALAEFLSWLEDEVAAGRTVSEVQVDVELTKRRAVQEGFVEPSFATIAGAGPNGAIIHYRAQESSCRSVDSNTLLLLDSGGQYDCGTTDITRTLHLGTPTEQQRRCYTRVLQGHIALDQAVFPEGTPGAALDVLARLPLWKDGLNYRHGTGHGVGAALNVHEGPQSISMRYHITTPLQAHMVCSNEPGYYEDNSFGVRIENLVVVKEVETANRFGGMAYFGFERLTLVPIQTKMMDASLMTNDEIQWVDQYHEAVWQAVSSRIPQSSPRALEWLRRNTRPLAEQQKQ